VQDLTVRLRSVRRRLVTRLALAVVIPLVFCMIFATGIVVMTVRQSLPTYDGRAALPGLSATAEVRRDAYGIPQIYAATSEDLFRAQGYVHAQDRFFEMDFKRRLTAGRLAEWFGEDLVPTDALIRTLGWRRVAEKEFPLLSARTRGYLEAYADGVNAFLSSHSGSRLSVEYTMGMFGPSERPEPWTPVDSLAWLKAMAWDLRSNLDDEIDRALISTRVPRSRVDELYPAYPYNRHAPIVTEPSTGQANPRSPGRATLPDETVQALRQVKALLESAIVPSDLGGPTTGLGSNSWVVSGRHTTTGKPLLANDPHLAASLPSIWYQMGLHCPDPSPACRFDVSGFSFAGVPGIIIGHNDRIAWGFTNLGADVMDLYVERLSGDRYLDEDSLRPLAIRRETIGIADQEPIGITVRATRHGPLISDVHEEVRRAVNRSDVGRRAAEGGWRTAVALRWTALDPGTTAEAIFRLNAAHDWADFRAAAKLLDVPAQNMVYADVDGHIGYQAPGRIPIRRHGTGQWPVPGWTREYDWSHRIPFDQLPSVWDPPSGVIVTANQAIAPRNYPYRLTDRPAYGYRSDRIGDLLQEAIQRGKVDAATMQRIQTDTYNAHAAFLVPYLRQVKVNRFTAQAQRLFDDWDYTQPADSAPAAYFNAVWWHILALTFRDELPRDAWPDGGDRWYEVVRRLVRQPDNPWWDDVRTKKVREDRDAILVKALTRARLELTRVLAKDPQRWEWGNLHRLHLVNMPLGSSGVGLLEALFNRGPYSVGGGSDVVLATGWNAARSGSLGEAYRVTALPSMRMVVDLADFDRSRWINLTGVSGHPWSRHYTDQVEPWIAGESVSWPFSQGAVDRLTEHRLTLRP